MTPMEVWSRWPAPAKLNLFLQIVGRRDDGYHLLQTVFQLLDWGDEIALRVIPSGRVEVRSEPSYGVSPGEDLTLKAAKMLKNATNCPLGVEIVVHKRIPLGGGFGGGSSDAATVLVALDRLWGTGLSEDALVELAQQLGADVPVFVRGRTAWAEGVGERLQPLALPSRTYLLVDSGVSVPTGRLFQAPDLTRDAPPAKIADFLSGTVRGNAFEPVLRRLEPAVEAVFTALAPLGEVQLTGTGGGCFIGFADREQAEAARQRVPATLRSWIANGVNRSPLLEALERSGD